LHLPEIDRYGRLESPIHRVDPRLKLATLGGFLLAVNLTWDLYKAAFFLIAGVGLLFLSRLPVRFVLWHLRAPAGLALVVGFFLALFTPGPRSLGPFTLPGLLLAATVLTKVLACFAFFLAMVATAPLFQTLKAAKALLIPEKLLALLLFTYRYLFTLLDQLQHLTLAMQARGFREGTNRRTYQMKARLYALLLLRAYQDTEKVLLAMYARGFSSPRLSSLPPLSMGEFLRGVPLLLLALFLLGIDFFW